MEIFIPLSLILLGFSISKIQLLFEAQPYELSPSLFGEGAERIILNRQVINPPSDVILEPRDPYITMDEYAWYRQ
jgi:hypothetical protein